MGDFSDAWRAGGLPRAWPAFAASLSLRPPPRLWQQESERASPSIPWLEELATCGTGLSGGGAAFSFRSRSSTLICALERGEGGYRGAPVRLMQQCSASYPPSYPTCIAPPFLVWVGALVMPGPPPGTHQRSHGSPCVFEPGPPTLRPQILTPRMIFPA